MLHHQNMHIQHDVVIEHVGYANIPATPPETPLEWKPMSPPTNYMPTYCPLPVGIDPLKHPIPEEMQKYKRRVVRFTPSG
ncbi:hypothetical protein QYM36_018165, partial [Artemia franciscana]